MIKGNFETEVRKGHQVNLSTDLLVAGGGMSGICTAITAARAGIQVVLVQDRPVLGGNASSEIRLWILGATSHMGNNNRWAREGGVIDEILLENLNRNKEGNTLILDAILLEMVVKEHNITLLLNTALYDVSKSDGHNIKCVSAFCSQNSTTYIIEAPLFCDASGDGIMAFKAGAAFRMGAEDKEEFGELFAPDKSYGELLGHTLYFYSKAAEAPVKYVPPAFALANITELPKYKLLNSGDYGCRLWWIEYGGNHDTVHDTEKIKWELWKIIYGVWDYIKNSGEFADVDNLTLEWVGTIPGKRESRRFEGHYMLRQQDVVEQRKFIDAVAFGGWSIDLHPSDGVYSKLPSCNQFHAKGIYQIPYRCYVSRDINNLFYAGRIISASHIAFGSSRVMATCAHGGQAVGMAAALCLKKNLSPIALFENNNMAELQQRLNISGQSIPGIAIDQKNEMVALADISVSSTYVLRNFPENGPWMSLNKSIAQMLPVPKGEKISLEVLLLADAATELICELRTSSKPDNHTPDLTLQQKKLPLRTGEQKLTIEFDETLEEDKYAFFTFLANRHVKIKGTTHRVTGILSVFNKENKAVSNRGKQVPPPGIGIDTFEFWTPERRPLGHNIACSIHPPVQDFSFANLNNGYTRPYHSSNAWVADLCDTAPRLELKWEKAVQMSGIQLHFDGDFDHPLESSLQGHPEAIVPFVVRDFKVCNEHDEVLYEATQNHQTICRKVFENPISTNKLKIYLQHPSGDVPAALFHIHLF